MIRAMAPPLTLTATSEANFCGDGDAIRSGAGIGKTMRPEGSGSLKISKEDFTRGCLRFNSYKHNSLRLSTNRVCHRFDGDPERQR